MSDPILRAVGQLEGQLAALQRTVEGGFSAVDKRFERVEDKLEVMDDRLRKVERSAAVQGAISGGVMGVGVMLLKAGIGALTGGKGTI